MRLRNPGQLVIFSSFTGRRDSEWLNQHTVRLPVNARLAFGGTAAGVGARAAAAYFRDGLIGHPADEVERILLERYAQLPVNVPQRVGMSDAKIGSWIRKTLRTGSLSCSGALRLYRDSGFACEQSRFRMIYSAITGSMNK
jgi:hypothetical protein